MSCVLFNIGLAGGFTADITDMEVSSLHVWIIHK